MKFNTVQNGIVLDHIEAGKAMEIYNYLHLNKLDCFVAVLQNTESEKYGKKDIIKINQMIDLDLERLGYMSPNMTINTIKDGEIVNKTQLSLPETLTNVIKCENPHCITTIEQEIKHIFKLVKKDKRIYRCIYCDTERK